jgi:hypothetical protein
MGQEEVFVGTVFVTEEDSDGDSLVGIETERYEIFIEEGKHDEELRELEGETISAKGSMWIEDSGERWLDLRSFDSHGVSGCIPASGFSGSA